MGARGGEPSHIPADEADGLGRAGRARSLPEVVVGADQVSATSNRLCPALQTLSARLSPTFGVVDCGGSGDCGPLTVAFLLKRLGLSSVDGHQLRYAVVEHARHRAPRRAFDTDLTLEAIIEASLRSWPSSERAAGQLDLKAWCNQVGRRGEYTDAGFICAAADLYSVQISVTAVASSGAPVPEACFDVFPCDGVAPLARLRVAAVVHQHFAAVVKLGPPSSRGGAVADPKDGPALAPIKPPAPMLELLHLVSKHARRWDSFTSSEILVATERAVDVSFEESMGIADDDEARAVSAALAADSSCTSSTLLLGQQLSADHAADVAFAGDTDLALAISASTRAAPVLAVGSRGGDEAAADDAQQELEDYSQALAQSLLATGRGADVAASDGDLVLDEDDDRDLVLDEEGNLVERVTAEGPSIHTP